MLETKDFYPEKATPEEAAFAKTLQQLDTYPLFARVDFALFALSNAGHKQDWKLVDGAKIALAAAIKEAHRQSQDDASNEKKVDRPQLIDFMPYIHAEEDDFTRTLKQFEDFSFATKLDYAMFALAKARFLNDWKCVTAAIIALAAAVKIAKHGHC